MLTGLSVVREGKGWSVLPLASEEAMRENVLSPVEESVLLLAREEAKRGREWLARPFMLPWEVTRTEWRQSFSLDEICKFETPTAKTIPAQNNDLKFFLLQHYLVKLDLTRLFNKTHSNGVNICDTILTVLGLNNTCC